MRTFRLFAVVGLASMLAGCGVTGNFRNDPGYAAFDSPAALDTNREFGISLGPLPLSIARWALEDEPEIQPLIQDLRAVRVYTYEVTSDAADVASRVRATHAELLRDGWLPIATVREADEFVAVLLKIGKQENEGLAVLITEPEEVTFVNLIGDVRLDFINEYLADIDVETPRIEIDPETLHAHAR
jgi:hypothetical protein